MAESNPAPIDKRLKTVDAFVSDMLSKLTREEKVRMCHAVTKFNSGGVKRLGIPDFVMSDGPHGVRQEVSAHSWAALDCDDDQSVYLPTGTALAATWNPAAARLHGETLGAEARRRGKDVILGPGVNILRLPTCGRNFEYCSEDPFLTAELAVPEIRGIQSQDTAACVKHFACNSQELNRTGVDARPSERALREIYLPAFEAAVTEGETLTVMGAYNKLYGHWCCHNRRLLMDILKAEWGFRGAVISDWNGARLSHEAATDGLDIEMGTDADYDDYHLARPFLEALEDEDVEDVTDDVLNDKVSRILHAMYLCGVFDENRLPGAQNMELQARNSRTIAEQAPVLLKNDGHVLPLDRTSIKKLAVIGENAVHAHAAGGGSSGLKTFYEVTPLQGLQEKFGDEVEVVYEAGYPDRELAANALAAEYMTTVETGSGVKGWEVQYFRSHELKDPVETCFSSEVKLNADPGEPPFEGMQPTWWAVRWRGTLVAPETGTYTFALGSDGGGAVSLDDCTVIEYGSNPLAEPKYGSVDLEEGKAYRVEIIYKHGNSDLAFNFGWLRPGEHANTTHSTREAAIAAARAADAVVFVGGLGHSADTEGTDRPDLKLPGGQDDLIEALAEANPNLVVLIVAGSAVEMPWADKVPAILYGWYAGMEAGHVFADIILGDVAPCGRLPFTLPKRLEDSPAHAIGDYNADVCLYAEDILVGYRWFQSQGIPPRYPFGHGLTYTTFEYSSLTVGDPDDNVNVEVSCTVTNTGKRVGTEVVQVYVEDVESTVLRPPRELKGFARVTIGPGERQDVTVKLDELAFAYFDEEHADWRVEPGLFRIHVGSSVDDIHLCGEVEID